MRILIISTFFPPQNSIASLRPYSFAKFWQEEGHEVEILTTEKHSPENPLELPLEPFHLIEVPLPEAFHHAKKNFNEQGKSRSFLKKILEYLRFKKGILNACRMPDITDIWAVKAFKAVSQRKKYDVIVSTAGPYSTHLLAWRLKKKGLADFWAADYRDTWSDNYIYPGLFPFNLIERMLEKRMLKDADLVSTISEPFAKQFREKHKAKTITIENGFDASDMAYVPTEKQFPDDGKFRIVHTGSIYLGKRDPGPFLRAVKKLADPRLEVHFFGARNANLEEIIRELEVAVHCKFVTREKALAIQRDADLLLFLPWSDATVEGVLTGKLFEYLYSKTPILSAGPKGPLDSAEELMLSMNAGHSARGEEAILEFLKKALATPPQKTSFNQNSFSRKELACKFLSHIQQGLACQR